MLKILRTRSRREDGAALVTALGLLAVFAMLGSAFLFHCRINEEHAKLDIASVKARYLAMSGAERARAYVTDLPTAGAWDKTEPLGDGAYTVRITPKGALLTVVSEGKVLRQGTVVGRALVRVTFSKEAGRIKIVSWSESIP